ncbi:MAG: hypothetical protein ABW139_10005 [Candidatus Thiodiazotropha sp. DIVDIV]
MSDQPSTAIITAAARNLIPPSLQFVNYMSLPMPAVGDNRLFIAFLLGRGEALNPELGYQVWPPSLLALFEIENGQFHEIRAVTPAYFSIDQEADQPIGKGVSPPDKNTTDYLQNELHLFQSCDALINALQTKQPYQKELERFDDYVKALTDPPLIPYLQQLRLSKVE